MAITLYDTITDIINMINDNWGSAGDAGVVPRIERVWEEKKTGFIDDRRDILVVEPLTEDIKYFNLYATDFLHTSNIRLDIRSYQDLERHNNIVKEIVRIVKDQVRRSNYVDVRVISTKSLNHLYRNMYRHIIEIRYRKVNP